MTLASDLNTAEKLLSERKTDEALEYYNAVLKENSKTFKAYIGKSKVFQKTGDFQAALGSLQRAREVAEQRGKKELIDEVLYRLFVIKMNEGDVQEAVKYLNLHTNRGNKSSTNEIWMHQLRSKAAKKGLTVDFDASYTNLSEIPVFESSEPSINASEEKVKQNKRNTGTPKIEEIDITDEEAAEIEAAKAEQAKEAATAEAEREKRELEKRMANHDNLFASPKDIRLDWFQSGETVTVSIFLKHLPKDDKLKVKYFKERVEIEFPTSPSSEFMYNIGPLFSQIVPSKCSHRVFSTKLELYLAKGSELKWKKLERQENEAATVGDALKPTEDAGSVLAYPNSSKKSTDWSKLTIEEEEEEHPDGADCTDDFFKKLYGDADDDTKRAMLKSYVESGGTALSTNWGEVKDKQYAIDPPEGMVAKKW